MNLEMPDWTKEIFPEPGESLAALVYGYHNYDQDAKKINAGYMLKKIVEDSQNKLSGDLSPSGRKLYLYSGHESTMGYMLDALDIHDGHVPPYGSALSFEIYKGSDDNYIKVM